MDFESDELLALARLEIDKGDIEQALLKLKKVLAEKKVPAEANAMAARLYARLGLFERAQKLFKAMAARLYARLGLFERAQKLFKSYLKQRPDDVVEAFQYGMVHLDLDDEPGALEIWSSLLEKEPNHPPAMFYRGLVLARQNQVTEATNTLKRLLDTAPRENLYYTRAMELLKAIENGKSPVMPKNAYQSEEANSPARNPKVTRTEH